MSSLIQTQIVTQQDTIEKLSVAVPIEQPDK
jgi:hypothetical protein